MYIYMLKFQGNKKIKKDKVKIMSKFVAFLKRKDIVFSKKRYFVEVLSSMALGLFASLLIGLIIKTIGQQAIVLFGENKTSGFLIEIGTSSMGAMGYAIGGAVAYALKAPPLVLFSSIITGGFGAALGGPAGALMSAVLGAEFGKAVSKETKIDILVTPAVTIGVGCLSSILFGSLVMQLMTGIGAIIKSATTLHPFLMGIIVAVVVGLALTAPISSAALCIMLGLDGLAGGAATAGCSAQMIGFAVMSYKENKIGGLFAQGLGTSMLQVSNIIKNPWILLPPTLAAAITGPVSTMVFKMTNEDVGSGMGTSGLVGQIGTFTSMGFTLEVLFSILVVHFILPAILSVVFYKVLVGCKKIKFGDCYLNL